MELEDGGRWRIIVVGLRASFLVGLGEELCKVSQDFKVQPRAGDLFDTRSLRATGCPQQLNGLLW